MKERHDPAAGPRAGTGTDTTGTAVAPADAFDALHERHAPALVRQTFLLCGSPGLARRSVARAFRDAWRHWPAIAVDHDPAGRVRAAAHRHALAPWRHPRPLRALRRQRAMRHVPPYDRELLDALLRLPLVYRAPLLLHDGLGLGVRDVAGEVEAGTAAAAGRVRHARETLAARVPALREVPPEDLPYVTAPLVRELAAPQPAALPTGRQVRRGGELRGRCATAGALGLVAALVFAVFAAGAPDEEPKPRHAPDGFATLAPERQRDGSGPRTGGPARPAAGFPEGVAAGFAGPLTAPAGKSDGPAPGAWRAGTGPFGVRARA